MANGVEIHNITRGDGKLDLRAEIIQGLAQAAGQRRIPTVVLYDEPGLKLYDAITTEAKEYYLFASEEDILRRSAGDVVSILSAGEHGSEGAMVLELGAGALRKTSLLLDAFAKHKSTAGRTTYYALDLEHKELVRTLEGITEPGSELASALAGRVAVRGLCGTYEDGIRFVNDGELAALDSGFGKDAWDSESAPRGRSNPDVIARCSKQAPRHASASPMSTMSTASSNDEPAYASSGYTTPPSDDTPASTSKPLHILFLGSSVGNFPRDDGAAFLRSLPLRPGSGDTLLLGLDGRNDKELVERAYHDPAGHTERFIMNGLKAAGRVLGTDELDVKKWAYESRYNEDLGRHEAYYKCTEPHTVKLDSELTVSFVKDELVHIENAYKYSDEDAHALFDAAGLRVVHRWQCTRKLYSLYMLERPAFFFPLVKTPSTTASFGMPTVSDWREMWKAWDVVTTGMIPRSMMHERPIDLRHICLFYLGHIPAFLDIHLSRLLGEPHTEPESYKDIFERGIDPHVDDPTQCHPHSEVPTNEEDWPALDDILAFRDRVRARLMRLYDDVAAGKRALSRKMARVLFMTLEHEGFHAETLLYMLLQRAGPPAPGTLPPSGFALPPWDLLRAEWEAAPKLTEHTVELGPTEVVLGHDDVETPDEAERPSSGDEEFGWDNESPKRSAHVGKVRMSWRCITNGEYLAFYEKQKDTTELPKSWVLLDGRFMVRTLYGPVEMEVAYEWPVLASYDALSTYATVKGGRLPTEPELRLFLDQFHHSNAQNVGFRNWHPTPSTMGLPATGGKGSNGGAWEWTSTVLDAHEGFQSSILYPGYSSDFFDGKHMVVLGGSYATIPRIAQRRTVRNFYQHNYPYAWVAGRVVYDA
ncbi:DUF323 domain-containing protein [Exidia glandulosa HHB12029]|uniref:DUF323 domain-containing protein n=1 Tax=Exidia glandulosa HHB12029 TaxID=1314781 RepID=A0A165CQI7_EXIGL|nr:DUF323 domain-containing protein [Exidia glandulosa HHB12029]